MTFELVRQRHAYGCGIASLAMVTRQSYEAVLAAWPLTFDLNEERGISCHDCAQYLGDRLIAHVLRYKFKLGLNHCGAQQIRDGWPSCFAPVHILGINGGIHDVVLLGDSTVLDPMQDAPRHLSDVGEVSSMLGVWPDVRLG